MKKNIDKYEEDIFLKNRYGRITYDMNEIVAVVPIKLNNQRLPGKNVKCFTNGVPLCRYILETLIKIKKIKEVYVYCSDESIIHYLPNGVKFLKRKKELDSDMTKMNEILKCFSEEVVADIYVMAHVTAPFVSVSSIECGINMVDGGKYDSSFSVKRVQDFLWQDGCPMNYNLDDIPRTQDLPVIYKETSGFYIFKRNLIREKNRRIGLNPYMVEVDEIESIDIDEYTDFVIADAVYNYSLNVMNQ